MWLATHIWDNCASSAVHYAGHLLDGTRLHENATERSPISFHLGRGSVLKGWDVAVATMTRGEAALITIHSDWAHGDIGSPPCVPPRVWVQFELHLLDWQEVSIRDLDRNTRVLRAQALKERGNLNFKANDIALAMSNYVAAFPFLEQIQGVAEGDLRCTLMVNQATCLAKLGRHAEVLLRSAVSRDACSPLSPTVFYVGGISGWVSGSSSGYNHM